MWVHLRAIANMKPLVDIQDWEVDSQLISQLSGEIGSIETYHFVAWFDTAELRIVMIIYTPPHIKNARRKHALQCFHEQGELADRPRAWKWNEPLVFKFRGIMGYVPILETSERPCEGVANNRHLHVGSDDGFLRLNALKLFEHVFGSRGCAFVMRTYVGAEIKVTIYK